MKRQRKRNPMTIRYVLICIAILIPQIVGIIGNSGSIFEMVTLDLILFVPIFIKRFKYNTDLGNMLIEALYAELFGLLYGWRRNIYQRIIPY